MADDNKGQGNFGDTKQHEEAGHKGGTASHPNGRGLENASQETRDKVAEQGGESSHGVGRQSDE
ncbi:MAG: general stress protein [Candidatus Levyibacteriota bacterium]